MRTTTYTIQTKDVEQTALLLQAVLAVDKGVPSTVEVVDSKTRIVRTDMLDVRIVKEEQ